MNVNVSQAQQKIRDIVEREFNNAPKYHLSFLMPVNSSFNLIATHPPANEDTIQSVKLRKSSELQSAYVSKYANEAYSLEISCDLDYPRSENKVSLDTSNTILMMDKFSSEMVQISVLSKFEIQATFISYGHQSSKKVVVCNNLLTLSEGDL